MSARKPPQSKKQHNLPQVEVVIPPQGRRKKPIVIRGEFLNEEAPSLVVEQNKAIAKHLLHFGIKLD